MIRINGVRINGIFSSIRTVKAGRFPWWLGVVFAMVGFVILLLSYREHRASEELKQVGIRVEAQVSDVSRHERHRRSHHGRSKTSVTYHPIVSYTDSKGAVHTVESSAGVESRTAYKKGDAVHVLYMPDAPERMEIVGLTSPFSHYIFMGVGGIFLIVGVGLTLYGLKHKKLSSLESVEEEPEDIEKPQPPMPL